MIRTLINGRELKRDRPGKEATQMIFPKTILVDNDSASQDSA